MRDYNYRKNWNDLLTPEIVKKLTLIHEYKGEQELNPYSDCKCYLLCFCAIIYPEMDRRHSHETNFEY